MSNETIAETTPTPVPEQPHRRGVVFWLIAGAVLFIILLTAVGAYLGYRAGIDARVAAEETQVAAQIQDQYTRALVDLERGRLDIAQQRFDWILSQDPNYPGVTDQLVRLQLTRSVTLTPITPTPEATITLTPTPDTRGEEQLFEAARQHMANQEWQQAYDTLESLRNLNLKYRPVDVDGMYYVVLRELGVQKIYAGSLEMGLYDFALAERFSYLDTEAEGLRNGVRYYLMGASFWKVDWPQSMYYFELISSLYPSMRDSTGLTARERYQIAVISYANQVAQTGDVCKALEFYNQGLNMGALNYYEIVNPQATQVWLNDECNKRLTPSAPPPMEATPTLATPVVGEATATLPSVVETPVPPPADQPTVDPNAGTGG